MRNDFIYHAKNILTLKECKSLIDFYEDNKKYHNDGAMGLGKVDHKKKKCTEMYISSDAIHPENEYFNNLDRALNDSVDKYVKQYPFLGTVSPWILSETFNIKKYLPSEAYFKTHCEMSGAPDKSASRRMLVWMVFLNDVTDGGETEFPTQCKKIAPRAGDVVLWPAYWTHPHHGLPSNSQIKYISTGWFSYISEEQYDEYKKLNKSI